MLVCHGRLKSQSKGSHGEAQKEQPAYYYRKKLTEDEIEAINSGGATQLQHPNQKKSGPKTPSGKSTAKSQASRPESTKKK
ncbi:Hypothetical protein NTJ_04609 [Nesidiocoris tenuis]|uniref:Uncharacterized protein n=1 Tax=Nesidiocoris tenuis TaxID=355587 RepID=A0ABN7ALN1_9HEMI|nr:Hypothetical protein NTJ_04609 [Nesidiocoris tenuis]